MSVVESYRESRFGRTHVHLGRFLGLFLLVAITFAIGVGAIYYVGIGVDSTREIEFVVAMLALGAAGAWLPAAVLTAAYAATEGESRAR